MAERKTNTITTPSGVSVAIKEYISAGEFLDATDTKDGTEIPKQHLAKKMMELSILSVNGCKQEEVPAALRELPLADYLFLSKEVAKITSGDFTVAKNP